MAGFGDMFRGLRKPGDKGIGDNSRPSYGFHNRRQPAALGPASRRKPIVYTTEEKTEYTTEEYYIQPTGGRITDKIEYYAPPRKDQYSAHPRTDYAFPKDHYPVSPRTGDTALKKGQYSVLPRKDERSVPPTTEYPPKRYDYTISAKSDYSPRRDDYSVASGRDYSPRKDGYSVPTSKTDYPPGKDGYSVPPKTDYSVPRETDYSPRKYGYSTDYSTPVKERYSASPKRDYPTPNRDNHSVSPKADYSNPTTDRYSVSPERDHFNPKRNDFSVPPRKDYSFPRKDHYSVPSRTDYANPKKDQYFGPKTAYSPSPHPSDYRHHSPTSADQRKDHRQNGYSSPKKYADYRGDDSLLYEPPSPGRERPRKVDDFLRRVQDEASRGPRFDPASISNWKQNELSSDYGQNRRRQSPSVGSLSAPTNDIGTALQYLKEAAKRDGYPRTIDSREAERLYGHLDPSFSAPNPHAKTIDHREAIAKYGGREVKL